MAIINAPIPDINNQSNDEKMRIMFDAYLMLRKELEYGLHNLDTDNLGSSLLGKISTISDLKGNMSTITQDLEGVRIRIEHTEETVSEIEQTVPYQLDIISTNGVVFKSGDIVTTLIARVYRGTEDITDTLNASLFRWKRVSEDAAGDEAWDASHFGGSKQINVTTEDVLRRATFFCELLKE